MSTNVPAPRWRITDTVVGGVQYSDNPAETVRGWLADDDPQIDADIQALSDALDTGADRTAIEARLGVIVEEVAP